MALQTREPPGYRLEVRSRAPASGSDSPLLGGLHADSQEQLQSAQGHKVQRSVLCRVVWYWLDDGGVPSLVYGVLPGELGQVELEGSEDTLEVSVIPAHVVCVCVCVCVCVLGFLMR